MKTIGIIGAMEEEIDTIRAKMEIISTKDIIGLDFCLGKMHGKNIVLVRSGIGKVNAAICTQILIDLYGADCCINVGVAGALSKELNIADVVISSVALHHDFDCTSFGHQPGVIPRMEESFFTADENLIKIAQSVTERLFPEKQVFVGKIASGDQFVSSNEKKIKIRENFKPLCVEMEGAAIAQTCFLNQIPFVVVRSISDKSDGDANASFDKFVKVAAEVSAAIVEEMVKEIN